MDDASLLRLRADLGDEDGLWPEHVPVVEAFLACETQWRVASVSNGFGARMVYVGLDYAACRVALELAGIVVTPDLWSGLQQLELMAIAVLNAAVPA